jgi:DNA-binding MarR family transcriptional regulator
MRLEGYLPYLVNRVGQDFVARFTPSLRAAGIDVQMWRVLIVLYADGPQNAGALAERTSINLSTLSRLSARMTEKGLVVRSRAADDARGVVVALTPAGRICTEALLPEAERLESVAAAGFTAEELAMLKALLERLYDRPASTGDARLAG